MKIGINDGCANGGMMDSLSIEPMEPGWEPMVVVDVPDEKWAEWLTFLKEHNTWDKYWSKLFTTAYNSRPKRRGDSGQ